MNVETVVETINRDTHANWLLLTRLIGGYQEGAYLLADDRGVQAVLKYTDRALSLDRLEEMATTVDHARSRGWPSPHWIGWGRVDAGNVYVITEFVDGEVLRKPDMFSIEPLLEAIEVQREIDPPTTHDWAKHSMAVCVDDAFGHASRLRQFSKMGERLVGAVVDEVNRSTPLRNGDLVHGNLDFENVLYNKGRIAGIVDVMACGRGSCVYDVATLLVIGDIWGWPEGVRRRLTDFALQIGGPEELYVGVAANLLALLDFGINSWPSDVDTAASAGLELLRRLAK